MTQQRSLIVIKEICAPSVLAFFFLSFMLIFLAFDICLFCLYLPWTFSAGEVVIVG